MGLLVEIKFWLIIDKIKMMNQWQRKLFVKAVQVFMLLADKSSMFKYNNVSKRDFTIGGTYKNQIHITRYLLWGMLEITWSSLLLKLGNTEVTLATLVTVPLMDKYRIRSIMDNSDLISYIILPTAVTREAPHKFNSITIQDINQHV